MDARRTLALAGALFATFAGPAAAQAPVLATNGSTLQAPANLNLPGGTNQCAARPYIGLGAGQIQFIDTGQTTCMWWSTEYGPTGDIIANTYVPRGAGAVTTVRVRSGASPAPLQFAILGSGGGLCCTTKTVSPPFAPAPNQVNQFAVNLPAGSGVGDTNGSQYNDILVVSVAGPGSLPVSDRGAHGFIFDAPNNQARAAFLHPALANGASNTDVGVMDGYEVLLQYDWCGVPMTSTNLRPVAPADPTTACLPATAQPPVQPGGGGANPPPTPPLRTASSNAAVRANRAAVRLVCQLTTACKGTLRLVKGKTLGRAKFNLKPGKGATVRVPLNAAGRKALKGRRKLAISLVLPQGRLPLTLKR